MKKLFKDFGFRKLDEMEVSIQLRSIRLSWFFGIFFLFIWTQYEGYHARINYATVNPLPSMLLVSQSLIFTISQLVMRKRAGAGDEEKDPTTMTILYVVTIAIIILVLGGLVSRILLSSLMR